MIIKPEVPDDEDDLIILGETPASRPPMDVVTVKQEKETSVENTQTENPPDVFLGGTQKSRNDEESETPGGADVDKQSDKPDETQNVEVESTFQEQSRKGKKRKKEEEDGSGSPSGAKKKKTTVP